MGPPSAANSHLGLKEAVSAAHSIRLAAAPPGTSQPSSAQVNGTLRQRTNSRRSTWSGDGSTAGASEDGAPGAIDLQQPLSEADVEELLRDSPFLDLDSPMTAWEWLKIVIMAPWILLRVLLTLLLIPVVWAVVRALTFNATINEPLPRWRQAVLGAWLSGWGHILLFLGFHMRPRVHGWEHLETARKLRALLIFNHVSYTDGLILVILFRTCGVAKASVAEVPFFGSFAKALQFLFIQRHGTTDRGNNACRKRGGATEAIHERARDPRFPLFMVGPEGTTKHSRYLLTFSTGAFVGGDPVLPVLLNYQSSRFDVGWARVRSILWHFVRLQSQFVNPVQVTILPPYVPSAAERADPTLYAENVRNVMGRALGARLLSQGIPEQQALKEAQICTDWTGRHVLQGKRIVYTAPLTAQREQEKAV